MKILVDTSIWIDFFKGSRIEICDRLESLISEDTVLLSDIVRAELLVGARSKSEFEELNSVLGGLKIAAISSGTFSEAGRTGFKMRKAGYTIPLIDLLVTAQAVQQQSIIWTHDKHFTLLVEVLGIDLLYHGNP